MIAIALGAVSIVRALGADGTPWVRLVTSQALAVLPAPAPRIILAALRNGFADLAVLS